MRTVTPPLAAADDSAVRELAWYDGLRGGRRDAFAAVATQLDPVLGDLALASAGDAERARLLVRRTWAVALPGLDLFAWRCSLRAWIAGVLVGLAQPVEGTPGATGVQATGGPGRPASTPASAPAPPALPSRPGPAPPGSRPGPADWSDLPWGARWGDAAWEVLEDARAGLPVQGRQVVVLADVHGWGRREAADAVGLTAWRYTRALGAARAGLHDALQPLASPPHPGCGHDRVALLGSLPRGAGDEGRHATGCHACATLARRWSPVGALLASTAARPAAPDPELVALFRRWRATRRRGLAGWLSRQAAGAR